MLRCRKTHLYPFEHWTRASQHIPVTAQQSRLENERLLEAKPRRVEGLPLPFPAASVLHWDMIYELFQFSVGPFWFWI